MGLVLMLLFSLCQSQYVPGNLYTIAGSTQGTNDNVAPLVAQFNQPMDVTVTADGSFYVGDYNNHVVRLFNHSTGLVSRVAGKFGQFGSGGEGGAPLDATLNNPSFVTALPGGDYIISVTSSQRVREVRDGAVNTIVGTGTGTYGGDGMQADAAQINNAQGYFRLAATGEAWLADTNNNRVRYIAANGVISTVAGTGTASDTGDGGLATAATLAGPTDVWAFADGSFFVAAANSHKIRYVNASGYISTYAGAGGIGAFGGDGGSAKMANLNQPYGLAYLNGDLYVSDSNNNRIRKIDSNGIITTVAGTGTVGNDDGVATSALLNKPKGMHITSDGSIFIADSMNHRIRLLAGTGTGASSSAATNTWSLFIAVALVVSTILRLN